jgi:hypothetical protein
MPGDVLEVQPRDLNPKSIAGPTTEAEGMRFSNPCPPAKRNVRRERKKGKPVHQKWLRPHQMQKSLAITRPCPRPDTADTMIMRCCTQLLELSLRW